MAAVGSFAKWVRPSVPGCPEAILLDAIVQAAIEFCTRSKILSETVEVQTEAYIGVIPLPVAADTEPVEITSLNRATGGVLWPSSRHEHEQDPSATVFGQPQNYYMDAARDLVVYPRPLGEETLAATVVITVSALASTLPDALLIASRYLTIAAGAKSRLMLMEAVPWSNPQSGLMNRAKFDDDIEAEQLNRAKGFGQKRLRTKLTLF